ncbi:polyprenol monophosphomannose synthase [Kiritimatiellaeota bacterium B1221]|nr:polyprenol monophosphomannose synthase [Kiritimatiellaeota bacterium B1221]
MSTPPIKSNLLLIPTYNERTSAPMLADAVLKLELDLDLLFIDDNSPDGTGEILDHIADRDPRVQVIHRTEKMGLGSAYLAGFSHSLKTGYQNSICMDADLSHNPEDLPRFISALEKQDLVSGSRYIKDGGIINWPLPRLLLSKAAAGYARLLTRMPFTDPTGGFNAYRNEMLARLPLTDIRSQGYSFQIEMKHLAWKQGFRVGEIPILFTERREGKSKMSAGIIHEALWIVWKLVMKR